MSNNVQILPWHNPALPSPAYCIPYGLAEAVAAAHARDLKPKQNLRTWASQNNASYQVLLALRTAGRLPEPAPERMTMLLRAFGHPVTPLVLTQEGFPHDLLFTVDALQAAHAFDVATARLLGEHLAGAYDCTALRQQATVDLYRRANRSAFVHFLETGQHDRASGRYLVPTVIPCVLPACPDPTVLDLERDALEKIQRAVDAYDEAQFALHLLAATIVVNKVERHPPKAPRLDIQGLEKWLDYIRRLSPPATPNQ